jgi:hypothetical protein
MSFASKLDNKEIDHTERMPQYRLAMVLIFIGFVFAIACAVFTPATIGNVDGGQNVLVTGL